mgnify:CR=1 FL=1|jgi:uncharacterized protein DUF1579
MQNFEMPKPTDRHAKLKALEGTWVGEEKIHPSPWDPKGGPAMGRAETKTDMDGFYVVTDYVQERDGKTCYKGHGVFGYEPGTNTYTMHWFDSMGFPSGDPAKGTWEGNRLTFQKASPMGQGRYIYDFEGEGKYRFKIENSQDGKQWSTFMEGMYTRK